MLCRLVNCNQQEDLPIFPFSGSCWDLFQGLQDLLHRSGVLPQEFVQDQAHLGVQDVAYSALHPLQELRHPDQQVLLQEVGRAGQVRSQVVALSGIEGVKTALRQQRHEVQLERKAVIRHMGIALRDQAELPVGVANFQGALLKEHGILLSVHRLPGRRHQ